MASDRSARLHRLAGTLTERFGPGHGGHGAFEAVYGASTREWTLGWTDGPTAEQVRQACRASEPAASRSLRYVRRLSQQTIALGAIRLACAAPAAGAGLRPVINPGDIERLWRDEPCPRPRTDRERALVYAVVYQVHDDHHRNWAAADDICEAVTGQGLAPVLRRIDAELSPIETLTAHYAVSRARLAWRYRLIPLTAEEAFDAVQDDPGASAELIAAALTLLPRLPEGFDRAAAALRARPQPPLWRP